MTNLNVIVTGVSPMLMHNVQLANPLNPFSRAMKAVTSKKKKTDSDHLEIQWLEWIGGLYLHPDTGRPCVPGENLKATWIGGGTKMKLGKDLGIALLAPEAYPLEGPGCDKDLRDAKNARALFDAGTHVDVRSVRNQQNRVMRTRPIFKQWAFAAEVMLDEEVVNVEQAIQALQKAGQYCGLGDYRPACKGSFGRFTVEVA